MSGLIADPGKVRLFAAVPLDPTNGGSGSRLTEREQSFIGSFIFENAPGKTFQDRAEIFGVLQDGLKLEITFRDGRKGGLLLKAL